MCHSEEEQAEAILKKILQSRGGTLMLMLELLRTLRSLVRQYDRLSERLAKLEDDSLFK